MLKSEEAEVMGEDGFGDLMDALLDPSEGQNGHHNSWMDDQNLYEGLTNMHWNEITMLLGEVERSNQQDVLLETPKMRPQSVGLGFPPPPEQHLQQETKTQKRRIGETISNMSAISLNEVGTRPGMYDIHQETAPPGALTNQEVRKYLEDAAAGVFHANIKKRFEVSPINPMIAEKRFYVIPRCTLPVENLYSERDMKSVKAIRMQSTKKLFWFRDGVGLQYRELCKTERKSKEPLTFAGCVYNLVRKGADDQIEVIGTTKFLQIWHLQTSYSSSPPPAPPQRLVEPQYKQPNRYPHSQHSPPLPPPTKLAPLQVATSVKRQTMTQPTSSGEDETVNLPSRDFFMEIFHRYCEALEPMQFKSWSEKYVGLLHSQEFSKVLKLYMERNDPRLKESFIAPEEMIEGLPLGVFKAKIDDQIFGEGGVCIHADETFQELVEMNPTGMKGFFVHVLSPLQRLCATSTYMKKIGPGQSTLEYFSTWRITQSALKLPNGKNKVLRINNIVYKEGNDYILELRAQDVSHLYPDIISLPDFLA